jgi:cell division protein FtsB
LFLFLFLFFFFRLVCLLLFYFFVTNITFRIGYIQNWSMRRRIAVIMKNHGGDIYFTLF